MIKLLDEMAALGIDLPLGTEARLLLLLDEVLRWNRKFNLTAITDRDEALEKHLVDSLTLLPLLRGDERLLDMGSGAGMPGLPLRTVLPELRLTSVDAVQKKLDFQRHAARLLGLAGVELVHARLETLGNVPRLRGAFEVVTARALADLGVCATYAAPLLAPGGRLIAMKGPEGEGELASHAGAIARSGLRLLHATRLQLPRSGAVRLLIELGC